MDAIVTEEFGFDLGDPLDSNVAGLGANVLDLFHLKFYEKTRNTQIVKE